MANVFVEHRKLSKGVALTWDIAHHLYVRYESGPTLIITDNPPVLFAALRKQWLKVIAKLRTEYSRTIEPRRRQEIQRVIGNMERLNFGLDFGDERETPKQVVWIVKPEVLNSLPDRVVTAYITCDKLDVSSIVELVVRHGSVITYHPVSTEG